MRTRVIRAAVYGIYAACAFVIAAAGGCTSIQGSTADGVSAEPPPLSDEQLALLERRTQREQELLAQPLTAESAAEIALLHHPAVERTLETPDMPGFDRLRLAHIVHPAFDGERPPGTLAPRSAKSRSRNVIAPA